MSRPPLHDIEMQRRQDRETQAQAAIFRAAAAALEGGAAAADDAAGRLLRQLGYLDGAAEQMPHRAALLRAAAGFYRVFTLTAEDAPGLVVVGAEIDPAAAGMHGLPLGSAAGTGLSFRQAFEACVGEAVEYLSQFSTAKDPIAALTDDAALADAPPALHALWQTLRPFRRDPSAQRTGWAMAAALADGSPVRLPFDLCFRRPPEARDIDPPWPQSTGCAAGPDLLAATLHGLLELIERDAVALWWRGGRRGRMVPPGTGATMLAQLRGPATGRHTWLLDITSDVGVPVVLAASCNADGAGLCCGHAAAATLGDAADAALREMAQMELAVRLAETKRALRGEAALNATDHQHLRRGGSVKVTEAAALQPLVPPSPPADLPAADPLALLAALRHRLAAADVAPCVLNLTRPEFGIPVVRVVCPGLEQGITGPSGRRLSQAAIIAGIDPNAVAPL